MLCHPPRTKMQDLQLNCNSLLIVDRVIGDKSHQKSSGSAGANKITINLLYHSQMDYYIVDRVTCTVTVQASLVKERLGKEEGDKEEDEVGD